MKLLLFSITLAFATLAQAADLKVILEDLRSDDAVIRDTARTQISELSVVYVPDLMNEIAVNYDTYRVRLGILIGLEGMLTNRSAETSKIYAFISDYDIGRLVQSMMDEDATMAQFAKSVLLLLDDPRTSQIAIEKAGNLKGNSPENRQLQVSLLEVALESFIRENPAN